MNKKATRVREALANAQDLLDEVAEELEDTGDKAEFDDDDPDPESGSDPDPDYDDDEYDDEETDDFGVTRIG